ncbi:DUF4373 domain-containing protein [Bacteroides caccae]|uniref:DUF4373 domain-containing protein n=1 Tax=Bacteroides caccae TaxID=47678 RepID=UPI0022AB2419|nr:DUF4373 domain-containing protein [Bacteroides caccae]MCZ2726260.1 DUF4373 domain-containing protein [Bacteroides caccae]
MGRKNKIGLEYFPFDIDLFSDLKIRKLIKYQGGKAFTVYALLLCIIYKQGYYMRWDEELPFIVSEQTGFEEAYILEVIKCCLVVGLFSKDLYDTNKVLTSKGIQERYQYICNLSKRKCVITEFNLISSEEIPISSEETTISSEEKPENSGKSAQSKGKERKENNNKTPPIIPPRGEVREPIIKISEIKDFLLKDELWKENACRQSGLSVDFLPMIPMQIDKFLSWIQATGAESTVLTLPDAKRRFVYWWKYTGLKEWKDEKNTGLSGKANRASNDGSPSSGSKPDYEEVF